MRLRTVTDVSNYQGALSVEQFRALKAAGVEVIVCGTDGSGAFPNVYAQQIAAAVEAGLEVEAYVFIYFATDIAARTNQKLDLIQASGHVSRVWLDCEDVDAPLDTGAVVSSIATARDAVHARGFECGIYTGRWWWVPRTGDNDGFWNLKLWAAQYDQQPYLNVDPFGGWESVYRKQYTDKGSLAGISPLDLNVELTPAPPPPTMEQVTARYEAEIAAMIQNVDAALAPHRR